MTEAPASPVAAPRVALRIGVDQAFLEGAAEVGYAARLRDITPERPAQERRTKGLVVPVGYQASMTATVSPGSYLIEAVSPSGEILEEVVHISGDEGSVDVRLKGDDGTLRDRPGLAWQLLSGNIASAAAPVAQAWRRHKERSDKDIKRREAQLKQFLGPWLGGIAYPLLGICFLLLLWRWLGRGFFTVERRGGVIESLAHDPLSWPLLLVVVLVTGLVMYLDRGQGAKKPARSIRRVKTRAARDRGADAPPAPPAGPADPAEAKAVSALLFAAPAGADAARQLEIAEKVAADPDGADAAVPTARLSAQRVEEGYWQVSVAAAELPAAARAEGYASRFLIARAADGSAHMVALPLPWESLDGSGPRPVDVLIGGAASPISTAVADAQFATLLGYLSSGQMTEARLLAGEATDFLRDKLINPFAAAAGAYALLSADDTHQRQPWREWVANLHAGFPQLPDGAVLQGWSLLQTAEDDAAVSKARSCFLEAADRGIPVFAEGVRRLAHGLSMFAAEDPDGRVKAASAAVEQLAIRCHPQQPFTTLRLGGPG